MNCIKHESEKCEQEGKKCKKCKICIKLGYLFSDVGDYLNYEIQYFSDYYHQDSILSSQSNHVKLKICNQERKKFRWNTKQKEYLKKKFDEFPSIGIYDINKSRIHVMRGILSDMNYNNHLITNAKIKSWFKNERGRRKDICLKEKSDNL